MIIYRWTGEYLPPKKGEWFMEGYNTPVGARMAGGDMSTEFCRWILRREEIKPNEEAK